MSARFLCSADRSESQFYEAALTDIQDVFLFILLRNG